MEAAALAQGRTERHILRDRRSPWSPGLPRRNPEELLQPEGPSVPGLGRLSPGEAPGTFGLPIHPEPLGAADRHAPARERHVGVALPASRGRGSGLGRDWSEHLCPGAPVRTPRLL